MDGQRLRDYWNSEVSALLAAYRQFETLLPNSKTAGSAHTGEDGRFVEDLVRSYLKKYLPKDLEVLTGFILRPAVKIGINTLTRSAEKDNHSTQLDIIVYDSGNYPIFQRFSDSVIVPPEGVVAIISVKKTISDGDIRHECEALLQASVLCRSDASVAVERVRGPFLALLGPNSKIEKKTTTKQKWILEQMAQTYPADAKFDDLIGLISNFSEWSIFKSRPKTDKITELVSDAKYMYKSTIGDEHFGFQFLISGILSVYYDRNKIARPGYTAFSSSNKTRLAGNIVCSDLR